jgi:hypothetical protein
MEGYWMTDGAQRAPDDTAKKPYTSPRLVEYGSIAKLTETGGRPVADSYGRKACL